MQPKFKSIKSTKICVSFKAKLDFKIQELKEFFFNI